MDGEIELTTAFRPGVRIRVPGSATRSLPLEFCVRDNGPGIPEELLDAPVRSLRDHQAGRNWPGSCTGRENRGDHGGIIECDCHPRRTTFRVLMPMHGRARSPRDPDRAEMSMHGERHHSRRRRRPAIRTVLTQALSRAGYDVRATGTAATLWRWVEAGEGDLVITDVVMPDENALELLPRIKKLRPDLPIIVMSAQNTFMTAIKASERGAYDYLPKPFDLKELVAIVGRALSQPEAARRASRTSRRSKACRWSAARPRCRRSTARSRA